LPKTSRRSVDTERFGLEAVRRPEDEASGRQDAREELVGLLAGEHRDVEALRERFAVQAAEHRRRVLERAGGDAPRLEGEGERDVVEGRQHGEGPRLARALARRRQGIGLARLEQAGADLVLMPFTDAASEVVDRILGQAATQPVSKSAGYNVRCGCVI